MKQYWIAILSIMSFWSSLYGQLQSQYMETALEKCEIDWEQKEFNTKMKRWEFVLDSVSPTRVQAIYLMPLPKDVITTKQNIDNYIQEVYYQDAEILINLLNASDGSLDNFEFYPYILKNQGDNPKKDVHAVVFVCDSPYLLSYFAYLGLKEEYFLRYKCLAMSAKDFGCNGSL